MSATRFKVILADPPWHYRFHVPGHHNRPQDLYETMTADEIAAIPVAEWAAEGAVLALWTTWPQLVEAMAVMAGWGFQYVTGLPWVKTTAAGIPWRGTGVWFQGVTEPLLVGYRGKPGPKGKAMIGLLSGEDRSFWGLRRGHSKKPPEMHDYLEQFDGPYLELFAREKRAGWDCWGLDTGFRLSEEGVERVAATTPQGELWE